MYTSADEDRSDLFLAAAPECGGKVDAMCNGVNAEFFSSYMYLSMAAWFDNENLPGIAVMKAMFRPMAMVRAASSPPRRAAARAASAIHGSSGRSSIAAAKASGRRRRRKMRRRKSWPIKPSSRTICSSTSPRGNRS